MAGSERLEETRGELVAQIAEDMRRDGWGWSREWIKGTPRNPVTGTEYRGRNALLLMYAMRLCGYDDPRFLTFNQARKAGCPVRKGSHGHHIERWREIFKTKDGKRVKSPAPGDLEALARLRADPDIESFMACVGSWVLFNARDLDGFLDRFGSFDRGMRQCDARVIDALERRSPCPVDESLRDEACYIPSGDRILIPSRRQFGDPGAMSRVLLHEQCHATGAPSRLDREQSGAFGSKGYAEEELVAELGCVFVANDLGLDLTAPSNCQFTESEYYERHVAYLKSWSGALDDPEAALLSASTKAGQAADYLMRNCFHGIREELAAESIPSTEAMMTMLSSRQHRPAAKASPVMTVGQ